MTTAYIEFVNPSILSSWPTDLMSHCNVYCTICIMTIDTILTPPVNNSESNCIVVSSANLSRGTDHYQHEWDRISMPRASPKDEWPQQCCNIENEVLSSSHKLWPSIHHCNLPSGWTRLHPMLGSLRSNELQCSCHCNIHIIDAMPYLLNCTFNHQLDPLHPVQCTTKSDLPLLQCSTKMSRREDMNGKKRSWSWRVGMIGQ